MGLGLLIAIEQWQQRPSFVIKLLSQAAGWAWGRYIGLELEIVLAVVWLVQAL